MSQRWVADLTILLRKRYRGAPAAAIVFLGLCGFWCAHLASNHPLIASAATGYGTYTTNFPLTESPISEGGNWINGGTTGLDWGNVHTTGGTAEGVGPASAAYSDPTAVLAGSWGPNQTVTATVYSNGVEDKPAQGYDKEVEIRLRTSISAHSITGYEKINNIFSFRVDIPFTINHVNGHVAQIFIICC